MDGSLERAAVNDSVMTAASLDVVYQLALCVKPHRAGDSNQLEMKVGDRIIVLEQDETGWWGGHKEGDDSVTAWFPGACVDLQETAENEQRSGVGASIALQPEPQAAPLVVSVCTAGTYQPGGDISVTLMPMKATIKFNPAKNLGELRKAADIATLQHRTRQGRSAPLSLELQTQHGKSLDAQHDSMPVAQLLGLRPQEAPRASQPEPELQAKLEARLRLEAAAAQQAKDAKGQPTSPTPPFTSSPTPQRRRSSGGQAAQTSPRQTAADNQVIIAVDNRIGDGVEEARQHREAAEKERLVAEKARAEAAELQMQLADLQRKRDEELRKERRSREQTEASAQQQIQDLQQQIQALRVETQQRTAENEEQRRSSEHQLEKERRNTQALKQQSESERQLHQRKAQEQEKRLSHLDQDNRRLQDELRVEAASRASYGSQVNSRDIRGSIGSASHGAPRGSVGSILEASQIDIPLAKGAVDDDYHRRRLFSSTVSNGPNGTPRRGELSEAEFHLSMTPQQISANTRAPPPMPCASPPGVRSTSGAFPSGGSRTTFGVRSESVPRQSRNRAEEMNIAPCAFQQRRAESQGVGPLLAPPIEQEEIPPAGCVSNKVREFEQRFTSPRRGSGYENALAGGAGVRSQSARRAPSSARGPAPAAPNGCSPPHHTARVVSSVAYQQAPAARVAPAPTATVAVAAPVRDPWVPYAPLSPRQVGRPLDIKVAADSTDDEARNNCMSPLTAGPQIPLSSSQDQGYHCASPVAAPRVPVSHTGARFRSATSPAQVDNDEKPAVSVRDRIRQFAP